MVDHSSNDAAPPVGLRPRPDFSDTEETFRHLSDSELREASWLFAFMGRAWLSDLLSRVGAWAVHVGLPGAAWGVKRTIYRQFVGGTDLEDATGTIQRLHERGVASILDYGAEAKSTEADFDRFLGEVLRATAFAASAASSRATTASGAAPLTASVVVKVTGLAPNEVLEEFNERALDFDALDPRIHAVVERLDRIAKAAAEAGVQLYIDAEESWFQGTVDQLADEMMRRYNQGRAIVLNTYQLYRKDRLGFLASSDERAQRLGYVLGAKLVRGAYMEKEGERARELGYPTPIHPNIEATHRDFDAAVRFCIERHERIACTIGTHNEASTRLGTELMDELRIPRDHPHVCFAQLLGMSDNLTFNVAAAGFRAAKYVVYGPVREVLPYLVRRAQENQSVTGEMGRERRLIELERRRRHGR